MASDLQRLSAAVLLVNLLGCAPPAAVDVQDGVHPMQANSVQISSENIDAIAIAPDGSAVFATAWNGKGKKVVLDSSKKVHLQTAIEDHRHEFMTAVACSPVADQVAFAGEAGKIFVLNASTLATITELSAHQNWVLCLQYSPNGDTLASGVRDGTIRFWDTQSWKQRASIHVGGWVDKVGVLEHIGGLRVGDGHGQFQRSQQQPPILVGLAAAEFRTKEGRRMEQHGHQSMDKPLAISKTLDPLRHKGYVARLLLGCRIAINSLAEQIANCTAQLLI